MGVNVVQGEGEVSGVFVLSFTMGNAIASLTVKCFRFVCQNFITFPFANVSLESSIRGIFGDIFSFKIKLGVYEKLENVAINDILPLKAARRYAIPNAKWIWGPGTPATSFRWFHLHSLCGATLFGSHQRHLPASIWHMFADLCVERLATKQNTEFTEGGRKPQSYFYPFVDQSS